MHILDIAIFAPLDQSYSYSHSQPLEPGVRVLVYLRNQKTMGVVLGESSSKLSQDLKIRPIISIFDETPAYSAHMLQLARWLSHYYLCPLGEVLKSMLPGGGAVKSTSEVWQLTDAGKALIGGSEIGGSEFLPTEGLKDLLTWVFAAKAKLAKATILKKTKEFFNDKASDIPLAHQVEEALKALLVAKLVSVERQKNVAAKKLASLSLLSQAQTFKEKIRPIERLSLEQLAVISAIKASFREGTAQKPFLIHGVTGSGKTEVYLQLISALMAQTDSAEDRAQVLVMVPEISLTPQMLAVFESSFPQQVACVHSAMKDTLRWQQMENIRSGLATVLIGPRSSVFVPFRNLKLIIVDEEHDSSYKQDVGLSYNGRDVAVLRGKLEQATVVLGSATPSMESYFNAKQGKYQLLEMRERVENRPLPEVFIIKRQSDDKNPIDKQILEELRANLKDQKQAMLIVNRRGFAHYLLDVVQKKALCCPRCSISLTLHEKGNRLRCHYCGFENDLNTALKAFPNSRFLALGYGSERAEEFLRKELPEARIARVDSDMIRKGESLAELLQSFREGNIDILVGTQMLAKGHDFPKVTLMAICDIDKMLELPDLRAGERTFQLLVQAAGRSGRGEDKGKVLLQSAKPEHEVIQAGLNHDYGSFVERELAFRKAFGYPPFSHLIVIEFSADQVTALDDFCAVAEGWVKDYLSSKPELLKLMKVLGPAKPSIEMINKRYRRTLLISSPKYAVIRSLVEEFLRFSQKRPKDIRIHVDVDPQSLL